MAGYGRRPSLAFVSYYKYDFDCCGVKIGGEFGLHISMRSVLKGLQDSKHAEPSLRHISSGRSRVYGATQAFHF